MTDFAAIADRLAEFPTGWAPDPHTYEDAINALREAEEILVQRDELAATLRAIVHADELALADIKAMGLEPEPQTIALTERAKAALASVRGVRVI